MVLEIIHKLYNSYGLISSSTHRDFFIGRGFSFIEDTGYPSLSEEQLLNNSDLLDVGTEADSKTPEDTSLG